jgi:basic membrane lipoprotein Med (substrate-binding protein (PBP1-ABC) superfamily)
LALAASAALVVAACGSDDSESSSSAAVTESASDSTDAVDTTSAGGEELSVVLLIGGPADDGGFYQSMVDGLNAGAEEDGAIEVTVREQLASGGDASLEAAVREAAASEEFDLIVAHGFDLVPAVGKFAAEFPDQTFVTSLPVEGEPPNAGVYLSVFEEIGYNAGFLAAQGTTSGKIGFVGGPGLPFELQVEAGFKEAVAEYAPDAEVSVVYTGSFEDPQLAQEATTQLIADGHDSIWNAQAAGQSGVYTACAAAPEVNCFGNSPYSEAVSPDVVLASTVSAYGILVPLWAERLRTDTWTSVPDFLTQSNGGTVVTDATAAGAAKLPDLQAAIDGYRAAIAAGDISVTPAPQE